MRCIILYIPHAMFMEAGKEFFKLHVKRAGISFLCFVPVIMDNNSSGWEITSLKLNSKHVSMFFF